MENDTFIDDIDDGTPPSAHQLHTHRELHMDTRQRIVKWKWFSIPHQVEVYFSASAHFHLYCAFKYRAEVAPWHDTSHRIFLPFFVDLDGYKGIRNLSVRTMLKFVILQCDSRTWMYFHCKLNSDRHTIHSYFTLSFRVNGGIPWMTRYFMFQCLISFSTFTTFNEICWNRRGERGKGLCCFYCMVVLFTRQVAT